MPPRRTRSGDWVKKIAAAFGVGGKRGAKVPKQSWGGKSVPKLELGNE
jgi:hypothetical protein